MDTPLLNPCINQPFSTHDELAATQMFHIKVFSLCNLSAFSIIADHSLSEGFSL